MSVGDKQLLFPWMPLNVMIPPFQTQYSHCICYTCAPLASLLGPALPQPLRFSFGNRLKSKLLERTSTGGLTIQTNTWQLYGNILLLEEIRHQLIGSLSHCFQGFNRFLYIPGGAGCLPSTVTGSINKNIWKSYCCYIKSKASQHPHQPETLQPRHGRRPIKWIILRWCLALEVFHGMTWTPRHAPPKINMSPNRNHFKRKFGLPTSIFFRGHVSFRGSKPSNFHGLINASMYRIDIIKGGSGNLPSVGLFLR